MPRVSLGSVAGPGICRLAFRLRPLNRKAISSARVRDETTRHPSRKRPQGSNGRALSEVEWWQKSDPSSLVWMDGPRVWMETERGRLPKHLPVRICPFLIDVSVPIRLLPGFFFFFSLAGSQFQWPPMAALSRKSISSLSPPALIGRDGKIPRLVSTATPRRYAMKE